MCTRIGFIKCMEFIKCTGFIKCTRFINYTDFVECTILLLVQKLWQLNVYIGACKQLTV